LVNGFPSSVAEVATGVTHSCLRQSNNIVWCWGYGLDGQLGNASMANSATPAQVSSLGTGAAELTAGGAHSCARKQDHTLWCWGANDSGQFGTGGTPAMTATAVQVSALGTGVAKISAGSFHMCAIRTDGFLLCWGFDNFGQVGDGMSTNRLTPFELTPLGNDVTDVSAGGSHTCARKADGTLWCWGANNAGQLGTSDTVTQRSPVRVLNDVSLLSAGSDHTCARMRDGRLLCWGSNQYGQLGNGITSPDPTPSPVLVSLDCR